MIQSELEAISQRLRLLEDQIAIYQVVCAYGYAVDGMNADAVGALYAEDGVYAVADLQSFNGREKIAGITRKRAHLEYVNGGCAHMSTLPHVVVKGDKAIATCHTALLRHAEDGSFYIFRVSASRLELSRTSAGGWEINHRQNYLLDGGPDGPALLARLHEGPPAQQPRA